MEKKVTYAEALTYAIDRINNVEMVEALTKLRAQVQKRSTSKSKAQIEKEQQAEAIAETIVQALASAEMPITMAELKEADESLASYTTQRLSAIMAKLVERGQVVKTIEKRKAMYSLAEQEGGRKPSFRSHTFCVDLLN